MKKTLPFILFSFIFVTGCSGQGSIIPRQVRYAVAQAPTPVLNTPDFDFVFGRNPANSLGLDKAGLLREVEFIALPDTVFTILDSIEAKNSFLYKVTTNEYPYPEKPGLFIDSRFVKITNRPHHQRPRKLPAAEKIIKNLLACRGAVYIWGGNYKKGIPDMLNFYPPLVPISPELKQKWTLKGLDCSGLLYEATLGCTPRNTSALVNFGSPVKIAGLDIGQIIEKIKPLDLIAWDGHVIIVLDKQTVIQSRPEYDGNPLYNGVRIQNLNQVLREVLRERTASDNYQPENAEKIFVIRRWHPDK